MRKLVLASLLLVSLLVGIAIGAYVVSQTIRAGVRVNPAAAISVTDLVTGATVSLVDYGIVDPGTVKSVSVIVTYTSNQNIDRYLSITTTGLSPFLQFGSPQHRSLITPGTPLTVSLDLTVTSGTPASDYVWDVNVDISDTPIVLSSTGAFSFHEIIPFTNQTGPELTHVVLPPLLPYSEQKFSFLMVYHGLRTVNFTVFQMGWNQIPAQIFVTHAHPYPQQFSCEMKPEIPVALTIHVETRAIIPGQYETGLLFGVLKQNEACVV